jgi:hypothetical protein
LFIGFSHDKIETIVDFLDSINSEHSKKEGLNGDNDSKEITDSFAYLCFIFTLLS